MQTPVGWIGVLTLAALVLACGKGTAADGGLSDAGDGGPAGLTCAALLSCDQACGPSACTDGCYAQSTATGQGLFDALDACIAAACPSSDGGPCASSSSTACGNCNTQAATGTCILALRSCEDDTAAGPPNLDGGAVVPPAVDAGPTLNCGELLGCAAACPLDGGGCLSACALQATPEARALEGSLDGCLAIACPSADGGPCVNPASAACSGCQEQVELALPDTCAAQFTACESDTSSSPDAGSSPTALLGGSLKTTLGGLDQAASTLVVQGGDLYFAQVLDQSRVSRMALGDGGTLTHLGPPLPTPVSLAVDANNVYAWSVGSFAPAASVNNRDGTVVQIPLDGGAPITLFQANEVEYDSPYLNAIAVDAHSVYWVAGAIGNDGVIMRASIGARNAAPLYPGQTFPEAIATDGTNLYWTNWGTFDAAGHSNNDGSLWQGPVDGGTPLLLATGLSAPASIAIDAHNVYWTNLGPLGGDNLPAPNTGSVMQVAIGGGDVITLASTQAVPLGIAAASGVVYWTEYGFSVPGLILSAPAGGGTVVPLVAGLPDPIELTISGATLYWSDTPSSNGGGAILSLSPF